MKRSTRYTIDWKKVTEQRVIITIMLHIPQKPINTYTYCVLPKVYIFLCKFMGGKNPLEGSHHNGRSGLLGRTGSLDRGGDQQIALYIPH